MIHVLRKIMNLSTFMNEKLDTRLEFPTELNIFPYTKEGNNVNLDRFNSDDSTKNLDEKLRKTEE